MSLRIDRIGKVLINRRLLFCLGAQSTLAIGLLTIALSIISVSCEVLALLLLLAVAILVALTRARGSLAAHELLVQRVVQDADWGQILIEP